MTFVPTAALRFKDGVLQQWWASGQTWLEDLQNGLATNGEWRNVESDEVCAHLSNPVSEPSVHRQQCED